MWFGNWFFILLIFNWYYIEFDNNNSIDYQCEVVNQYPTVWFYLMKNWKTNLIKIMNYNEMILSYPKQIWIFPENLEMKRIYLFRIYIFFHFRCWFFENELCANSSSDTDLIIYDKTFFWRTWDEPFRIHF
jgi:hypothetical protein